MRTSKVKVWIMLNGEPQFVYVKEIVQDDEGGWHMIFTPDQAETLNAQEDDMDEIIIVR